MNPNIHSAAGRNRNFGLEGAGKGDADRTSDTTEYNARLAEVNFPCVPASEDSTFTKSKRGYKKVYGAPAPTPWADSPIHDAIRAFENEGGAV